MNKSKFLRRVTGLSLVVPAMFVTATVLYAYFQNPRDLYRSKLCFIRHQCAVFRFGVELPMATSLCFDTFVLIWSAIAIQRQSKAPGQSSGRLNGWKKWKITLGMTISLGLTWLLGVFPSGGIPTQMLFDISCGLQGFLMFILFVALQEDTRKVLCCTEAALVGVKLRKSSKVTPDKPRVVDHGVTNVANGLVSQTNFVS